MNSPHHQYYLFRTLIMTAMVLLLSPEASLWGGPIFRGKTPATSSSQRQRPLSGAPAAEQQRFPTRSTGLVESMRKRFQKGGAQRGLVISTEESPLPMPLALEAEKQTSSNTDDVAYLLSLSEDTPKVPRPLSTKPSRLSMDARRASQRVFPATPPATPRYTPSVITPSYPHPEALQIKDTEVAKQRALTLKAFSQIRERSLAEKERLQRDLLKQQPSLAQHSAAVYFSKGIPSVLLEPKTANAPLKEQYSYQKLLIDIDEQLQLYSSYHQRLSSYLLKREALLPDQTNSEEISCQLNNKCSQAFEKVHAVGISLIQTLIPSFAGVPSENISPKNFDLSSQSINHLFNTIALISEVEFFILRSHTSIYITESKKKLDEIEAFLDNSICFKNKKFSDQTKHQHQYSQNLLSISKATFSLLETSSTEETIEAARNSAHDIQDQLEEIRFFYQSLEHESIHANPKNKDLLKAETEAMQQLIHCLEEATFIYREIEDETWIEKSYPSLHALKEEIQNHLSSFSEAAASLKLEETTTPLVDELKTVINDSAFELDSVHSLPQHPLLFLDHLEDLESSTEAEEAIISTHGKIALETLPKKENSEDYSKEIRRDWSTGIDAIRRGLSIGWGKHIVDQFDRCFSIKISEKNPLFLSELKNFLFTATKKARYARAFFIPSDMTHESFLGYLKKIQETPPSHSQGDKEELLSHSVIKIDDLSRTFNPFHKTRRTTSPESLLSSEYLIKTELHQREAGFQYAREALQKAFPEASLSAEQLQHILLKFDDHFKISHITSERMFPLTFDKDPLTLKELAHFIQQQKVILKNRNFWNKHLLRYLDQNAIQHFANGIYYYIGSHILPVALGILSYLYYKNFLVNHNKT